MRLSHKNKLLHKKGIPQRAWIGRCNRRLFRQRAKENRAFWSARRRKGKESSLAKGGYVTPQGEFYIGHGQPTFAVITPNGKVGLLESHTRRQSEIINQIAVQAKSEEIEDAFSAFSKAVREFGDVVKGKISSFFNRKGAL